MPKKKTTPALPVIDVGAKSAEVKAEGLALVSPFKSDIEDLTIEGDEDYQKADYLLSRVGGAIKTWEAKMEKIIRPVRQGLDASYELRREVLAPMQELDKMIREKMRVFKVEERRVLLLAENKRLAEEQRLKDEAAAKERAAQTAVTPQLRGRLAAQAERLTEQAHVVAAQETPAPVQAARSSERVPEKVRVHDLGLYIQGILDGTIEPEAVTVDQVWLNKQWKEKPEEVLTWPGVEKYEDLQIVRR